MAYVNINMLVSTIKVYCEQMMHHRNKQVVSSNNVGANLTISHCKKYYKLINRDDKDDSELRESVECIMSNIDLLYGIPNIRCPYHHQIRFLQKQLKDILDSKAILRR